MNLTASVLVAICVITSGVRAIKLDEVLDDKGYFHNTFYITNKGKSIKEL